jgi:hypothetical protein
MEAIYAALSCFFLFAYEPTRELYTFKKTLKLSP